MRLIALFFVSSLLFAEPEAFRATISAEGVTPAVHGPSIVELPNGEYLACWFGGSKEGASNVQILCARSKDSKVWEKSFVVVDAGESSKGAWVSNRTVGNTVLFVDGEGILWLFFAATPGGWSLGHVDYKISRDLGKTWSARSRKLVGGPGNLPRNKPLVIAKDKFLLPVYFEMGWHHGYVCEVTHKDGRVISQRYAKIEGDDHLQPTLIRKDEHTVYAYMRTNKARVVKMAALDLKSFTWSPPYYTNLPNPNSALDGLSGPNGEMLLVYNHSAKKGQRTPLSIASSTDGIHFHKLADIESKPDGNFAYPCIIHVTGGYRVVYSANFRKAIKLFGFNDEWLAEILERR